MPAAKKKDKMTNVEIELNLLPYIGMLKVIVESRDKIRKMNVDKEYNKAKRDLNMAREKFEDFLYNDNDYYDDVD